MGRTAIRDIKARQILDSRGYPTIEVDVYLTDGSFGRASVPSGASTGRYEAIELRDGNPEVYGGKGVDSAVRNIDRIKREIISMDLGDQRSLDQLMINMDGTENKGTLGANAILGVSLAVAKAYSASIGIPLYRHIGGLMDRREYVLPVPMVNIWNGGKHAGWATDIQEYMIVPIGAGRFSEGLRWCAEIFHTLKRILENEGYQTTVGDEGGFAPPDVDSNEEPLEWIMNAIEGAGYEPGVDIAMTLDPAASCFCEDGIYFLDYRDRLRGGNGKPKTPEEMIEFYSGLRNRFPIISIEDGLGEDDWGGWIGLTEKLGRTTQIVGDDLYATNKKRLNKGIRLKASNAILIKPNQIGTLTETLDTIKLALENGFRPIISHRSGETEDTSIAHIAVGSGAGQIKTGSVCRGERICKYNELLRIEEELE